MIPGIWKSCPVKGVEKRNYPIVIQNNSYDRDEVEIEIPEDYEVYYLPETVEIRNKFFEFYSGYRKVGGRIFYKGEYLEKAVRINPDDYIEYHELCQRMEKSFKNGVLLKMKDKPINGN